MVISDENVRSLFMFKIEGKKATQIDELVCVTQTIPLKVVMRSKKAIPQSC